MRTRARRLLLLAAVAVPACFAAACDGILGIPSDEELATDAAADARPRSDGDGGGGGQDATLDGTLDGTIGVDGSGGDGASGDGSPGSDGSPENDGGDGGVAPDGSLDAGCDPTSPFAPGVPIAELNDSGLDQGSVRLSPDERMIAFTRSNGTDFDLYSAIRNDAGIFGTPTAISGVNTTADEYSPNLSDDLKSIVFERQPPTGDSQLYYATRATATVPFAAAALLKGIAASTYTAQPFARGTLSTVTYVQADNEMHIEVYNGVSSQGLGVSGTYASSVLLPATPTGPGKNAPALSADGNWVYYSDGEPDGGTNLDMYVAPAGGGGAATPLSSLNTVHDERCGWISLDSCRLYYDSDAVHPGGARWLYVATRTHP